MYLSSSEIAQGRQLTLNNFQTASAACVSASERLAELFVRLGRQQFESLAQPQKGVATTPSSLWLSGFQYQSASLLGELLSIVSDAQQTVISAAAAQTQAVDRLLVSTLARARSSSPAEVLPVLDSLQHSIEQTEQQLSGWTAVARQSVALLESRFSQVANSSGANASLQ